MNLMEAINSKQPFTRPHWREFVTVSPKYNAEKTELLSENGEIFGCIHINDITATDYYIQPRRVTITEADFRRAVNETLPDIPGNVSNQSHRMFMLATMKALGLVDTWAGK